MSYSRKTSMTENANIREILTGAWVAPKLKIMSFPWHTVSYYLNI